MAKAIEITVEKDGDGPQVAKVPGDPIGIAYEDWDWTNPANWEDDYEPTYETVVTVRCRADRRYGRITTE